MEKDIDVRAKIARQNAENAARLSLNPYVKESLKHARVPFNDLTQGKFPHFDITHDVSFMSAASRQHALLSSDEFEKQSIVMAETFNRGVELKNKPRIPDYLLVKDADSLDIRVTADASINYVEHFSPANNMSNELRSSFGSMVMFDTIASALFDELTEPIDVEVPVETLRGLASTAIAEIKDVVENPDDPQVDKLMEELTERVGDGEGLSMHVKGAQVFLKLFGNTLDTYNAHQDELSRWSLIDKYESEYIKRLGTSKVRGKAWFIPPNRWPKDNNYRIAIETDEYHAVHERMMERENGLSEYLDGTIGFEYLENKGIEFKVVQQASNIINIESLEDQNIRDITGIINEIILEEHIESTTIVTQNTIKTTKHTKKKPRSKR